MTQITQNSQYPKRCHYIEHWVIQQQKMWTVFNSNKCKVIHMGGSLTVQTQGQIANK